MKKLLFIVFFSLFLPSVFAQLKRQRNPPSLGTEVTAKAGADLTCFAGEPVRLDGSASIGYIRESQSNGSPSILWEMGDGAAAENIIKPAHVYMAPGTYMARLTVKNSAGVASSDTVTINVVPILASVRRDVADTGDPETNRISLQAAIDAAAADGRSSEIVVPAGFVANDPINLPERSSTNYVTVRVSTDLPFNQRTTKGDVSKLFKIRARGASESRYNQAITINGGSNYYRFVGMYIERSGTLKGDAIAVDTSVNARPSHIIFDRIVIDGNGTDTVRGIAPNGSFFSVINSSILDIKAIGYESKAIGEWTGGGPLAVVNDRLEAASINILIGGAAVASAAEILDGLEFRGNYVWKSPDWVVADGVGKGYGVKNLFELKCGHNVSANGNIFENNYADGQSGEAVLIKSGAQPTESNPYAEVSGVDFRNNKILNTRAGFNVAGMQSWIAPHPPYANHIFFTNNFWQERSGRGNLILMPDYFEINHNTFVKTSDKNQWAAIDQPDIPAGAPVHRSTGFKLLNTLTYSTLYGSIFASPGQGAAALDYGFGSFDVRMNLFDGSPGWLYPKGNFFASVDVKAATDGAAIGVDQYLLDTETQSAISGIVQ